MGQATSTSSSYDKNQLDVTPLLHFNSSKVIDVSFSDYNQTVTFPSWTKSFKIVHFNTTLRKSVNNQWLCMRLRINYEDFCQVVVGLQCCNVRMLSEDMSDCVLLDVTEGTVYSKGAALPKVKVPTCVNDGEIEFQFNMKDGKMTYRVSNPGHAPVDCPPILLSSVPGMLRPVVGVLSTSRQPVTCSIVPVKGGTEPRYDPASCYGPILVSDDGCTVRRGDTHSNCCVLINRVLKRGKHSWVLKVDSDNGASTCLGVARVPLMIPSKYDNPDTRLYTHPTMHLWRSYQGLLYSNGMKQRRSLPPLDWHQGSSVVVKLCMDMDDGRLTIYRNGTLLGTAFEGLEGPLQPVIVFYSKYKKQIQLVNYESAPLCSIPMVGGATTPSVEPGAYFDACTAQGLVKVSEDGLSLTKSISSPGNAYCLLNKYCINGIYRWSFCIHSDQGTGICLGVTSEPVVMPTNENVYTSSSMYLVNGERVYVKGREVPKRIQDYQTSGTTVEVVCDMVNRVVRMSVDGVSQGTLCALEEGYYRPIVGLYTSNDEEMKISLMQFEHIDVSPCGPATRGPGVNEMDLSQEESSTSYQLPIRISPDQLSDVCVTCSTNNSSVLILPCKHVIYCPLCATKASNCAQCNSPIINYWNIF